MFIAIPILIVSLLVLLWSADRFVEGASAIARILGISPLLIGMVIVGFGTSVPEMLVSAISAYQGNSGIALGNAYGSNITNIALILGLTALIRPMTFQSQILRNELPLLMGVTLIAAWQIMDHLISRRDALTLLLIFICLAIWTIRRGMNAKQDPFGEQIDMKLSDSQLEKKQALARLTTGLILLIISSRSLVWGAVTVARFLGINDLIIGLTIVALGTSLPELASSVIAAKKGEHEIAVGNIIGSNLFNTLFVVGIAGMIRPLKVETVVITRDIPIMAALTLSLFVIGFGFKKPGVINRFEGAILLAVYIGYSLYLVI